MSWSICQLSCTHTSGVSYPALPQLVHPYQLSDLMPLYLAQPYPATTRVMSIVLPRQGVELALPNAVSEGQGQPSCCIDFAASSPATHSWHVGKMEKDISPLLMSPHGRQGASPALPCSHPQSQLYCDALGRYRACSCECSWWGQEQLWCFHDSRVRSPACHRW